MDLLDLLQLMMLENNGWVSMILIVLLVIFYILVDKKVIFQSGRTSKQIDDGFRQMSDKLVEQNKLLMDKLVENGKMMEEHSAKRFEKTADIIKEILQNRERVETEQHNKKINYRLEISNTINEYIKNILIYYHADRAELIEFHNSKENLNSLSFLWYDAQYQQTISPRIKPLYMSSHPINNITPIINDMSESEDGIVIYDDERLETLTKKWPVVKYYISENFGAKNMIVSGIFDSANHLIGFISIDYIDTKFIPELVDTTYLYDVSKSIGGLLKYDDK